MARAVLRPFAAGAARRRCRHAGGARAHPGRVVGCRCSAAGPAHAPDADRPGAARPTPLRALLRAPASRCCAAALLAPSLPASPLLDQLQTALGRRRRLGGTPAPADAARGAWYLAMPPHQAGLPATLQRHRHRRAAQLPLPVLCPGQVLGLRPPTRSTPKPTSATTAPGCAVLHRFHEQRRDLPGQDDAESLRAAADAELQGLDETDFLPYRASFRRLMPRYLAWLAETEAAGQRYENRRAGPASAALRWPAR